MKNLLSEYKKRKKEIQNRLAEFQRIFERGNAKEIFSELCFCLLTPQSKAVNCDSALKDLKKSSLLFNGTQQQISKVIQGKSRFHNNKSKYIVEARNLFKRVSINEKIIPKDILFTRKWFADNIKGLGYKESSHFLRNIGLGKDIAILDVHILKNLKKYSAIKEIPKSVTGKKYIQLEHSMKKFSNKINIPMDELDLLFWSQQTGYVFK